MFTFYPNQTGTQRRCAVFSVDNDGGGEIWETGGPRFLSIVCLSDFIFGCVTHPNISNLRGMFPPLFPYAAVFR